MLIKVFVVVKRNFVVVNFSTMQKLKLAGLFTLVLLILLGLTFGTISFFRPKVAGIFVDSDPVSTVFINGQEVGRTPFESNMQPGEITIRLIPDSFQVPLVPYETKIDLVQGVKTVLRREFGESEDYSGGEILSFEKLDKNRIGLVVVTIPDKAKLRIDNGEEVLTPYKTSSISEGQHSLTISADGFLEKNINIKTYKGYKLTAIVKLKRKPQTEEGQTTEGSLEKAESSEYLGEVEIMQTDVGFLRVRDEPSTLAKEVGRVEPGKKYPLVEIDEETRWYKIEYQKTESGGSYGWISNQYAKLITPTPTP